MFAQCILASIIVVALKGMLMKVTEFAKFWRLDKTDAAVWAITFTVVLLFDVEYGLLAGVLFCIGRLLVLAVRPYTCKLALAPGTELYLDARRYKGVRENLLRFYGFRRANASGLRRELYVREM